jgi:DNA mismatch repair protein PMS2
MSSIHVSDNGSGVPKSCRSLLATKHATSKLRSFGDLYANETSEEEEAENDTRAVSTLGFRGEALFSLANISSSLTISTRTPDESVGEELTFDAAGNVITRKPVARAVGTTVIVGGLLERLPVRRVDFCKRIKSQKMKCEY